MNLPEKSQDEKQHMQKMRIGEKLVSLGLISNDQIEIALQEKRNSGELIGHIMVRLGFITADTLGEVLAMDSGTKKLDVKSSVLDTNLIHKLPKKIALSQKVLPVSLIDDELGLAMSDVYNVISIDQIRKYFPRILLSLRCFVLKENCLS